MSRDAELLVLRHENAALRCQAGRVRYQPGDRMWLAALSRLASRHRWGEVFAVTRYSMVDASRVIGSDTHARSVEKNFN